MRHEDPQRDWRKQSASARISCAMRTAPQLASLSLATVTLVK
jgi:hypothetical protein